MIDKDVKKLKERIYNLVENRNLDKVTAKGVIGDFIHDLKKRNLLWISIDAGILDHMQSSKIIHSSSFIRQWEDKLWKQYGVSKEYAEWAAKTWLYIFNKSEYPEELRKQISEEEKTASNSNSFITCKYKGNRLLNLEAYNEAIECFNTAIEINPDDAEVWYGKGLASLMLRQYQEAVECYDRAIKIEPNNKYARYGKGLALFKLTRYEEASRCFSEAIKIDPQYAPAWGEKGHALSALKRYREALKYYEKAVKIDPNDAKARKSKEDIVEKIRQKEKVIGYFLSFLKLLILFIFLAVILRYTVPLITPFILHAVKAAQQFILFLLQKIWDFIENVLLFAFIVLIAFFMAMNDESQK